MSLSVVDSLTTLEARLWRLVQSSWFSLRISVSWVWTVSS